MMPTPHANHKPRHVSSDCRVPVCEKGRETHPTPFKPFHFQPSGVENEFGQFGDNQFGFHKAFLWNTESRKKVGVKKRYASVIMFVELATVAP